jgi:hypothetical protein
MREHHEPAVRVHERGEVLGGMPGRLDQADRRGQLEPLRGPVDPQVVAVPRPVVVNPRVREQRRVQRVVGMVVREHHVGDLLGCELEFGERSQDRLAPRHETGIDHHEHPAVPREPDRRAHPAAAAAAEVALAQDVDLGRHGLTRPTRRRSIRP